MQPRHLVNRLPAVALCCVLLQAAACGSSSPPLATVEHVDLPRFMGSWYVIANIPTFLERHAYNAVETYRLNGDGTIATRFTFRKGAFEGAEREHTARGFVRDTASNAIWGMQFVWPIKADYRIVYLTPDYSVTVVARQARDYVWIMARTPDLPAQELERLTRFIASIGYDTEKLQAVPQRWPQ